MRAGYRVGRWLLNPAGIVSGAGRQGDSASSPCVWPSNTVVDRLMIDEQGGLPRAWVFKPLLKRRLPTPDAFDDARQA